ncbi:MAG: hypothetical protein CFH35_01263 [Alphaproteobacteria bacterium MarineAlpha9_Bin5]|nr:MAG: hypothetical protein CFH35_01263 [Alphaproteobacteria bacterium MarineAlpha9_Bin5]
MALTVQYLAQNSVLHLVISSGENSSLLALVCADNLTT